MNWFPCMEDGATVFHHRQGMTFISLGNPDLKPEETETKEIGISISGDESKNFAKITFFESDIEELIEFGAPITNIGKVRIKGVEMSAEANIWASLQGFLSWTILEKTYASGEDFWID